MVTQDRFLVLAGCLLGEFDPLIAKKAYYNWLKLEEESEQSALSFLRGFLPSDQEKKLVDCLAGYPIQQKSIYKAEKWCVKHSIRIHETLGGIYINTESALKLIEYLEQSLPIRPLYETFLKECTISDCPSAYANFIHSLKKSGQYVRDQNHPLFDDFDFFLGDEETLFALFRAWACEYTADQPSSCPGYYSVGEAARELNISTARMLQYAQQHPQYTKYSLGHLLVNAEEINALCSEWSNAICAEGIINKVVQRFPSTRRKEAKELLRRTLAQGKHPNVAGDEYFPQAKKNELYIIKNAFKIEELLELTANTLPLFSAEVIRLFTQLSTAELTDRILAGVIDAQREGDKYFISLDEQNRIRQVAKEYISLDTAMNMLLIDVTEAKLNLAHREDRTALLGWMEGRGLANDLVPSRELPLHAEKTGYHISVEAFEDNKEEFLIWALCFRVSANEAADILLSHYARRFPDTIKDLQEFRAKKEQAGTLNKNAFLDVVDIVFSAIDTELKTMSYDEIESKIIIPNKDRSIASCTLLAEFLIKNNYTNRKYVFEKTGYSPRKDAYGIVQAATIVAACCNQEIWEQAGLIQKAVNNPRYASMWLYFSLHIFATWRSTDLLRLPPPILAFTPDETLIRIQTGDYSECDAKNIAMRLIAVIDLARATPNKTSRYQNVPDLQFNCPESCLAPFGLILSIAAAHHFLSAKETTFVKRIVDLPTIRAFFGREVAAACDNRRFSGRRFTKSMLQAIEYEAIEGENYNANIAYYFASIMRSHKGGYGAIPETTKLYLKDANFADLSAEKAAYIMLERGACSLLAWKVLEACYGEAFLALNETNKTKLIQATPTPFKTERTIALVNRAEDMATRTICEIQRQGGDLSKALVNILIGLAQCKDTLSHLCLQKALEKTCPFPLRTGCLGCKYEMLTKQLLIHLVMEKSRLSTASKNSEKNKWLVQNIIYPAILEIVIEMPKHLSEKDIQQYRVICEEVVKEYGIGIEVSK